jgi:serine/threonine protein kinase
MDPSDIFKHERELKILQDINHPFCLKFVDELKLKESKDTTKMCIIIEYYPHGNLYTLIRNHNTFTEEEVLQFLTMLLL